eukprot:5192955-Heterocapsa_arctica.AAC.1
MENPRAARRNWRNEGTNLAEWNTHRERRDPGKPGYGNRRSYGCPLEPHCANAAGVMSGT